MKGDERDSALDSLAVTEDIVREGNLSFYLRTLFKDPRKILRGIADSVVEILVFLFRPRERVPLGFRERVALLGQFVRAELRVPGATTVLETIWLVYAIARVGNDAHSWVEVGCFKGLSTVRLSLLAEKLDKRLFAFDTFTGLPGSDAVYETVSGDPPYHFKAGSYRGSEEEVRRNLSLYGRADRVVLCKGHVRETLRETDLGELGFAFLDVDLVESYRACLEGLAPAIRAGSVIVVAEAAFVPIRALVEDASFWKGLSCRSPKIRYIEDTFGIRSCHNLGFLQW